MKYIKNIKISKRKLIIFLSILEIILLFLLIQSYNNKNLDKYQFGTKDIMNNKLFAIMVEDDNGDYQLAEKFPTNRYLYNPELSSCIDIHGNKVSSSITYSKGLVTVETAKTIQCYLYFKQAPPDLKVVVSTDGTEGTVPTKFYNNSLDCTNGTYNQKYLRLEFTDLNTPQTCNLAFTTNTTSYPLLSSKITATTVTQGNEGVVNEGTVSIDKSINTLYTFEQTDYDQVDYDTWEWDDTNKTWTSTNHTNSATGTITFNTTVTDTFSFCYIQSSEKNYDYTRVYINGTEAFNLKGVSNTSYECRDLGTVTERSTIKVTYSKDSSVSTGDDNVIFYIKGGTYSENVVEVGVGYRYEGTNPDNYVWFNNELWRIIGLIPTKTSSGTENLVKIIRNASIGGLAYDAKSSGYTGVWGSNTLYTLLNNYFYGKQDGTGTAYCYGYQATAKAKCDYTSIGISTSDYYGKMVKNVYWNTGASSNGVTASAAYTAEIATQTVTGYIGLMSASDYGYASSGSHTTNINSYNSATHTLGDWLYGNCYEWISINKSSDATGALYVYHNGRVYSGDAALGFAVRPVLYLDSSVYVVNGSGTESDPYILGM